jgi:asparaginyl-tRNA synthetase
MARLKIKEILNNSTFNEIITIKGWVRTFRNSQFIALNDGSTINNLQCVVDFANTPEETLKRITTGAAISITGKLVESTGAGQKCEVVVTNCND